MKWTSKLPHGLNSLVLPGEVEDLTGHTIQSLDPKDLTDAIASFRLKRCNDRPTDFNIRVLSHPSQHKILAAYFMLKVHSGDGGG
jgi:hypothetical protein